MSARRTSQPEVETDTVSDWACAAGLALLLLVTYSVCLTSTYAHLDDYWLLRERARDGNVLGVFLSAGRGANALLIAMAWWPVQYLRQLWIPRCFSLVGLATLVVLVFWSLRKLGYGRFLALLSSGVIGFLPSFTVYVAWTIMCSSTYGMIAAIGAFWAIEGALRKPLLRESLLWAMLGTALFVLAMNVYQPAAMFYFTMLVFLLLSPGWECSDVAARRRIGLHVAAIAASLGVSFLVLRLSQFWFTEMAQRTGLDLRLAGKIPWFLTEPLGGSLLLPFFPHELSVTLEVQWALVLITLPVVALGLYLFLPQNAKGRIGRVAGALAILPLTYLPNLVVQERWASYRTRGAIAAAVAFVVLAAAFGILSRLNWNRTVAKWAPRATLVLVALLGLITVQHHIVAYFVIPSQVEWRLVRHELAAAIASHPAPPQEVTFLAPTQLLPIPYNWCYDEFGSLSISRPWVPEPICWLIVREIAPDHLAAYQGAKFVIVPPGKPIPQPRQDQWIINARMASSLSDRAYLQLARPGLPAPGNAPGR